jgi:hypothetical protein
MTFDDYLDQTEHAMRQFFKALSYYLEMIDNIKMPIATFDPQEMDGEEFKQWLNEDDKNQVQFDNDIERYFGKTFSQKNICGAILQVAFMGIKKYSTKEKKS